MKSRYHDYLVFLIIGAVITLVVNFITHIIRA